ncbi:hypothetical protein F0562_032487 [Nyssa sinensis]|uniref:Uncharacterized protein n=1 Tax=Nyssa sinensis TaxID=561372 RepID=A0A5J5AQ62_9ASTE|nr:hypothetical protein F0562_032487 [Nyssa sinensis]
MKSVKKKPGENAYRTASRPSQARAIARVEFDHRGRKSSKTRYFTSELSSWRLCFSINSKMVAVVLCRLVSQPLYGTLLGTPRSSKRCLGVRVLELGRSLILYFCLTSLLIRSFNTLQAFQNVDSSVIGNEEGVRNVTKRGKSVTRVLIPGLPDESSGDYGAPISSCFWEWKPRINVHYEKSESENVNSPQVIFLLGFSVGSFHYEKQLKDLGHDFRVRALDFLRQGMSCHLKILLLDLRTRDQVRYFVEEDFYCKSLGN